ncbi:MAG: DUF5615 family PIN-like protein, partial [Acidimicrobiia bacterium]
MSGRRVARALRKGGHDVRAADEERELDGMPDEDLLALATAETRILVTFNVADFPRIVRRWAEEGRRKGENTAAAPSSSGSTTASSAPSSGYSSAPWRIDPTLRNGTTTPASSPGPAEAYPGRRFPATAMSRSLSVTHGELTG